MSELVERAKDGRDPVKHLELLELMVEYLTKARSLDGEKKLN